MAEIAAAAAIVQFIDVGARLTSHLVHLCSEVRNVPDRFYRLQLDLRQQVEVAKHIKAHCQPDFATTVASPTFDAQLFEYIALADDLCKKLDKILANRNDGLLQRGWSSLCSVRKKEDVLRICERLEQMKSTLSMWLSAANLKLSSNVTATADQIKLDVEETLTLAKTVKDTSIKAVAGTEQLLPQLEQMFRIMASSSGITEQTMRDIQQLKAQSAVILADTGATTQKSNLIDQTSTRILLNTELILQSLHQLSLGSSAIDVRQPRIESLDTIPRPVTDSLKLIADNDSLAHHLSTPALQRVASTISSHRLKNLEQSYVELTRKCGPDIEVGIHAGNSTRCTCRTVNNTRRWQPLSTLHFTRTFRTQHFSFCPEYRSSEKSLELTMRLVPPSWLLSRTIDLGIQVKNWWNMKPLSISPIVIGTSRLVDSETSPAFRALMATKKELYETGQHHICIPRLQNTLQDLFDQQKASALDTDRNGRTLLKEVLWTYIYFPGFACGSKRGDEYVSLIQFLLDKGADPNILSSPGAMESSGWIDHVGGTIFDEFSYMLVKAPRFDQPRRLTIFKRLAAAGSEFSKPFKTESRMHPLLRYLIFTDEVQKFIDFEDQIDLCELGGFVPIILQQSEKQFQRAVNKAKLSDLNRSSPINGLAPMHFAVLWPTGLRILIEKGANVNAEDHHSRRPIHLAVALGLADSVEYLIKADCALFTPPGHVSLLHSALNERNPEGQRILDLLVPVLINRHTRLLDLARELLPSSSFSELNIIRGQNKERYAPRIIEILTSYGISVPEALELDGKSFYDSLGAFSGINLTPDVANAFWNAGFVDINEPNQNGLTPLLQSWFCANFEMVAWFAEKGISLLSRHRDAPLTALHLHARRIDEYSTLLFYNLGTVPTDKYYMAQIQEEVGIPYDDCTCPCSPNGCTPVKFLCENKSHEGSRKDNLRKWFENVEPERALLQQYIYDFTRCLLFNFLGGKHTCCYLYEDGRVHMRNKNTTFESSTEIPSMYWRRTDEFWKMKMEHYSYCVDGIPTPRQDASLSTEGTEELKMTLDSLMSHYYEMSRPDMMLPEEQPFHYINWIIAEQYLKIDVRFDCTHNFD